MHQQGDIGAHFNFVVTLAAWLQREVRPAAALLYVVAQALGGLIGTALAHLMFDLPIAQLSQRRRTGGGQWIGEVVATAGLLLVIGIRGMRLARPSLVATGLALPSYLQ